MHCAGADFGASTVDHSSCPRTDRSPRCRRVALRRPFEPTVFSERPSVSFPDRSSNSARRDRLQQKHLDVRARILPTESRLYRAQASTHGTLDMLAVEAGRTSERAELGRPVAFEQVTTESLVCRCARSLTLQICPSPGSNAVSRLPDASGRPLSKDEIISGTVTSTLTPVSAIV